MSHSEYHLKTASSIYHVTTVELNSCKAVKVYIVLDDQSNCSLACSELFNFFNVGKCTESYTLKTCSGITEVEGRRAKAFIIESIDGRVKVPLPTLPECDMIPDDWYKIPSPEVTNNVLT